MKFDIGMLGVIVWIIVIIRDSTCIKWLGLGKLSRVEEREMEGFTQYECERAKRIKVLQRRHYNFCLHSRHRFAMHAIMVASKAASFYCMKTFQDRRWNCKSVEKLPKVSPELQLGTQEQAIVHAFSSAGLLYEISRRCSQSKLRHCPCGKDNLENKFVSDSKSSTYYYANCPDNVQMGMEYAKKFLGYERMGRKLKISPSESLNPSKSKKQLMKRVNGHNYAAGLEIMKQTLMSKCKCHGVSGSCANEICFRQLRRLDDDILLKKLKDHYLTAKYVVSVKDGNLYTEQDTALQSTELAFMEHSPDYCDHDPKVGSMGTVGRQCETENVTIADTFNCSNMCCGRSVKSVIESRKETCKCVLDPNFSVVCQICTYIFRRKICN